MQQRQSGNDWTKDLLVLLTSKNRGCIYTSCAVINPHSLPRLIDRLHLGTGASALFGFPALMQKAIIRVQTKVFSTRKA